MGTILCESFEIPLNPVTSLYCSWDNLPDPDSTLPTTEAGLSDLFQEIRTTVGQEVQIVQAVFPNPPYVMQVFLQRVFAQSVCPVVFTFSIMRHD